MLQKHQDTFADTAPLTGLSHQGACRGEGRHSPSTTASYLWWQADVCSKSLSEINAKGKGHATDEIWAYRNDDKTASEYQLEGGATLHLVLALRGGR